MFNNIKNPVLRFGLKIWLVCEMTSFAIAITGFGIAMVMNSSKYLDDALYAFGIVFGVLSIFSFLVALWIYFVHKITQNSSSRYRIYLSICPQILLTLIVPFYFYMVAHNSKDPFSGVVMFVYGGGITFILFIFDIVVLGYLLKDLSESKKLV